MWGAILLVVFLIVVIVCFVYILVTGRKKRIVEEHSFLCSKLSNLNKQYNFFQTENEVDFNIEIGSLQKLRQFDLYQYVVSNIRFSNYYNDVFCKIYFNKKMYDEYLTKYDSLSNLYTTQEAFENMNIKMRYKSYRKYEKKLYSTMKLKQPTLNINFNCKATYTSPAGRNQYTSSRTFNFNELKNIFPNLDVYIQRKNQAEIQKSKNTISNKPVNKPDVESITKENTDKFKKIINNIEEFEKNDKLKLIIMNFLKQEDLNNIEFFAIPKRKTSRYLKPAYSQQDLKDVKDVNLEKINYTLISALKKSQDKKAALEGYSLDKNNSYNKENEPIERLYKSLVGQNIIVNDDPIKKEAFYFLLSEKNRERRLELFKELSSQYDIKENSSDEEIIEKLYTNDLPTSNIIAYLALKLYSQNEYKLYTDCLTEVEPKIDECIESIKEKIYIDNLLTGQSSKISLSEIDLMSGSEFENFVAKIFTKMGYKTEVTKLSGDQGIDVLASKHDYVIAIQAKCYSGVVGNHAIMEAVGGMKFYNANKCMVITNSTFTKSAIELAKVNNVELWDRNVLKEKIEGV